MKYNMDNVKLLRFIRLNQRVQVKAQFIDWLIKNKGNADGDKILNENDGD